MGVNNQGIVHLRLDGYGGLKLACRRTDAHIAVPLPKFADEPRKCKRCEAQWHDMQARESKRESQRAAS